VQSVPRRVDRVVVQWTTVVATPLHILLEPFPTSPPVLMSWLLLLQVLDELLIAHHRLGSGSVDIAASDSFTPVHAACFHNSVEALVLLLTSKLFDVNARGRDGFTPLHIAAERGALLPVMFLMMDGAKRSFRTEAGDTAADIAERHGSTTVKVRAALFLGHVLRRLLIPTRCHFVSLNWL
jgi:ankyrin repeat protein